MNSITHGTPSSLTAQTAHGDMRRLELRQLCSLPMFTLGTLNPDPQHSFATMLVYRLCVPPTTATATRPAARASTSKRRVNHRSTDRSRAQKRVTTVAVTNAHVPAPKPPAPTSTSVPSAHTLPGASGPSSSDAHVRVRTCRSPCRSGTCGRTFPPWHRLPHEVARPALPPVRVPLHLGVHASPLHDCHFHRPHPRLVECFHHLRISHAWSHCNGITR